MEAYALYALPEVVSPGDAWASPLSICPDVLAYYVGLYEGLGTWQACCSYDFGSSSGPSPVIWFSSVSLAVSCPPPNDGALQEPLIVER